MRTCSLCVCGLLSALCSLPSPTPVVLFAFCFGRLRGAPGTVPEPSGERFCDQFGLSKWTLGGLTVRFETYMPNCTARLKHTTIDIYTVAFETYMPNCTVCLKHTNIHVHAQYKSTDLQIYISTYL